MAADGSAKAGDALQAYGFTGRRFDGETRLWYFRARQYHDRLGDYISRNPLGYLDGMKTYRALMGHRQYLDPSGLPGGGALAVAGGFAVADGPLPFGDVIALGIITVSAVGILFAADEAVTTTPPVVIPDSPLADIDDWVNDPTAPKEGDYKPRPEERHDPGPLPVPPGSKVGECKESCDDGVFKNYIKCESLPKHYRYHTFGGAAAQLGAKQKDFKKFREKPADSGPCVGKYGAFHYTWHPKGGDYMGSVVQCDCCEMVNGKPSIKQRYGATDDHGESYK